ncbi:DUF6809 family protein [Candidatus Soleaferrea massiliensis]|uniref:DUF6809 family protein n=1 Tax=Candidatus Soleaferrea massiliensis TaxID=1470354 RepID=UPI00058AC41A|nr:DUF6809 family protein [Candidatus Soleaferrea massiliensis]
MQNILHELYYGNIFPCENRQPESNEYQRDCKTALNLEEAFLSNLNEKQKEAYHQLTISWLDVSSLESAQAFADGFKLAVRVMAEVFLCHDPA